MHNMEVLAAPGASQNVNDGLFMFEPNKIGIEKGLTILLGREALVVGIRPPDEIPEPDKMPHELLEFNRQVAGVALKLCQEKYDASARHVEEVEFDSSHHRYEELWHIDPLMGLVVNTTKQDEGEAAFTEYRGSEPMEGIDYNLLAKELDDVAAFTDDRLGIINRRMGPATRVALSAGTTLMFLAGRKPFRNRVTGKAAGATGPLHNFVTPLGATRVSVAQTLAVSWWT
jgi:hypothetical protein